MSDSLVVVIGIVLVIVGVITIYAYINITESICEKCGIRKFDKGELDIHWFWQIPALVGLIYVVVGILTGEIKFGAGMNAGDVDIIELIGSVIFSLLLLIVILLPFVVVLMGEKEIYNKYVERNPDEAKNCYKLSLVLGLITSWIAPVIAFGFVCKMFFECIGPVGTEVDDDEKKYKDPFKAMRDGRGNKYYYHNDNYVKDEHGELHEIIDDGVGNKYIRDDPLELHRDENDRLR